MLEVLVSKRMMGILQFALDHLHSIKTATLELQLHLRVEEEVSWGQIW
jgi:hypothetical protein